MSVSKEITNFADDEPINSAIYSDNVLLAFMQKLADILLQIELLWSAAAIVYVYLSLVPLVPDGYYTWIALVASIIPFVLRKWRLGHFSARTPFDIPILIFMVGAIVGFAFSSDKGLSLRVFQSCLVGMSAYYMIVNYIHRRLTLAFLLLLALCFACLGLMFAIGNASIDTTGVGLLDDWLNKLAPYMPQASQPVAHTEPLFTWTYNIVLLPIIIASIMVGIIVFTRKWYFRVFGLGFLVLFLLVILGTMGNGIGKLFEGASWNSRTPLWQDAISVIGDNSWFVGLGLGMPLLFTQGIFQERFTHIHNAYIELYANTGVLGLLSAAIALVVVLWLAYKLARGPKNNGWYGFAVGILLSILSLALFSIFTNALSGYIVEGTQGYYYVVSPLPWVLGACLVVSYRLIWE